MAVHHRCSVQFHQPSHNKNYPRIFATGDDVAIYDFFNQIEINGNNGWNDNNSLCEAIFNSNPTFKRTTKDCQEIRQFEAVN